MYFDEHSPEVSALHKLYSELGDSATIQSSYDRFRYLMMMSILHRSLELTFLSLRNKIDRQNWRTNTKYWFKAVIELAPYILMYSLGYQALELFTCKLFTVLISNHIPHKVSSFIRDMDLISSDRCLKFIDFIKRNFLVMLRNLFVTYVLFELMLSKIFSFEHEDIFFKRDWAEIELCEKNNSNTYYMVFYSNASVKNLCYITDEFGWILGKMLLDLVWAFTLQKVLNVKDLRDPLRVHN